MYASKSASRNHSTPRTDRKSARRYESRVAHTAVQKALMRETDLELRMALRGTWIEMETEMEMESELVAETTNLGTLSF
jgi:predicted component of type VI protein secretion system